MKTIRIAKGALGAFAASVITAALASTPVLGQQMWGQQTMPPQPQQQTDQASQVQLTPPQPMREGNIIYVTGGVGENERTALESQKSDYDLRIINSDRTGAFMADTTMTIKGMGNNGSVINVSNTGPLFYAQVPPGHYTVEAMNGDKEITRKVDVSDKNPKDIHLVW